MSKRLPKQLFFVTVTKSTTAKRYGQKLGGKYSTLSNALAQKARIKRLGGDADVYECVPNWIKVEQ